MLNKKGSNNLIELELFIFYMPRKYKSRRTYARRYRKKWTAYNTEITIPAPGGTLTNGYVLENAVPCIYGASNSLGNNAAPADPVSAINYYICRPRFKGVIQAPVSVGVSYVIYLCYIPNAATVDNGTNPIQVANMRASYFYLHPEYVLAWTRLDYIANSGDTGEISLFTRVKKRINPGDRICLVALARNDSNAAAQLSPVQGTFSCYLRTN